MAWNKNRIFTMLLVLSLALYCALYLENILNYKMRSTLLHQNISNIQNFGRASPVITSHNISVQTHQVEAEVSLDPLEESSPPVQESSPPVQENSPPVQESSPPVQESVRTETSEPLIETALKTPERLHYAGKPLGNHLFVDQSYSHELLNGRHSNFSHDLDDVKQASSQTSVPSLQKRTSAVPDNNDAFWHRNESMENPIGRRQVPLNLKPPMQGKATIVGQSRSVPGFLTIGIPTVRRRRIQHESDIYLYKTLASLLGNTSPDDKEQITILIFLADKDTKYNLQMYKRLKTNYGLHLESGLIQLMMVPKDVYPPLTDLPVRYGDEKERIFWRSKQVVDFALMFLVAKNMSQYYLQIEDDVVSSPGFLDDIKKFMKQNNEPLSTNVPWSVLQFSHLGFIGKLFRSSDLEKLARFVLTFYADSPVDWLLVNFEQTLQQKFPIYSRQALFDHIGDLSSLDLKKQNHISDNTFKAKTNPWPKSTNNWQRLFKQKSASGH